MNVKWNAVGKDAKEVYGGGGGGKGEGPTVLYVSSCDVGPWIRSLGQDSV